MPVDPRVISRSEQRDAQAIADLRRRVDALEALRSQIGVDSITGAAIAPNSITTNEIATNTITAADIAASTITTNEIAANTITAADIAAGTITATQIAANTITAGQILAATITSTQIAASTITTGNLAAGAVTASIIAANAVTANAILAGAIDATKIATDTITATQIAAGAIGTSELAANSVTAAAIAAGAVTATKISVTDLGSITSNMGSITAGTITGGTIQTAASGSRVVMDSNGLRGYALDGVTKVFEINAGSGIATFTGTVNTGSTVPASTITGTIAGSNLPALGGVNLALDSSFEKSNVGGQWTYTGTATYDTGTKLYGTQSLKLTYTSGGFVQAVQQITVTPNRDYTLSAYFRSAATSRTATTIIEWYNASNALLSTLTSTGVATSTSAWNRATISGTAPATASYAKVYARVTTTTVGEVHFIEGVQFEEGVIATSWAPALAELGGTPGPDSITSVELAPGAVTGTELAANSVIAGKIATNAVVAGTIASNAVTAGTIAANAVTAGTVAANAITTNTIAAGAVTASKLTVDWGGSNMLWDSSFEDNTSSPGMWVGSNATLTRPNADIVPVSGSRVLKMVMTSTTFPLILTTSASGVGVDPNTGTGPYGPSNSYPGFYPVLKGKQYTTSIYVSSPAVSRNIVARLLWYDGLYRQSLTAPTLNSVVAIAGGSLAASTTYYYKVTALNANGETVGSAQLSTATGATNKTITVNATMPADAQGTDYPVTKWRIYRSTTSGVYTAGYIEQTAVGGSVVSYNDTGAALTAGSIPATNTAYTVDPAHLLDDGTAVPTELPTTTPNPPVTTSPTVVTGPFVVTGAAGGTLWSRWVRPYVTAVVPTGAAYARPSFYFTTGAVNEVHYFDGAQMERGDIPTGYARRVGEVLPGEVGATQITPNSITSNNIYAGGILSASIGAGEIKAINILAGAVDASKITVSTLSAITANMGAITAGTITGATFQTAAGTTSAVRFDSTGINAYNSSSVNTFNLSSTGTLTMTGKLTATGVDFTEPVGSAFAWSPPVSSMVRWLDASGGATRSFLVGDRIFATTPIAIDIHRLAGVGQDWVELMTGSMTAPTAKLHLEATQVYAAAGSKQAVIINSSGGSDFLFAGVVPITGNGSMTAGSASFTAPTAGTYMFYAHCTAYVTTAAVMALVGIGCDGYVAEMQLFCNEANSHKAFNPIVWTQSISAGSHNVAWRSDAWATWDFNDRITIWAMRIS